MLVAFENHMFCSRMNFKYKYRPGQPNMEYTMWKFLDFSAPQILRELNFGHFRSLKTDILTIKQNLNCRFLDIFEIFKYETPKKSKFTASKMVEMTVFDPLKSAKIDFT